MIVLQPNVFKSLHKVMKELDQTAMTTPEKFAHVQGLLKLISRRDA